MDLQTAYTQLKQCLIASKNRRDLYGATANPNFPDTQRYTITTETHDQLRTAFFALQASDEFRPVYPSAVYRFAVGTSGSTPGVYGYRIEPIAGGSAIFNYHISVLSA
jgi:hypothetical protein